MTPLFHEILLRVRKAGALGVASIGLLVAIAASLLLASSGTLFSGSTASRAPGCAIRDSAFLPPTAYGDFIKFIDESGQLGGSRFEAGFSGETRTQGFFTAVALEPRYRAENEAIARSWGYEPLADRPRLPLSGSIVLENPGLLEASQTISSFATAEEAADWMILKRGAPQELITPPEIELIQADDVVVRTNKPAGPEYQKWFGVNMRVRNLVVALIFSGGAGVTFSSVLPLLQDGLSRVRAECGR
jgi:hypothetical protein